MLSKTFFINSRSPVYHCYLSQCGGPLQYIPLKQPTWGKKTRAGQFVAMKKTTAYFISKDLEILHSKSLSMCKEMGPHVNDFGGIILHIYTHTYTLIGKPFVYNKSNVYRLKQHSLEGGLLNKEKDSSGQTSCCVGAGW